MKPRFSIGQRVRVLRASADWDAPAGALGVVASYDGANDRGTDWAVGFLRDGAVICEPAWPIDESCLAPTGPDEFDPVLVEDHCFAPDGSWLDEIITRLDVVDPPDASERLASAAAVVGPFIGGVPTAGACSWYPMGEGPGDAIVLQTTWCACRPWTDIVAALRRRFPASSAIIDDGWAVEFQLEREDTRALFGADALQFRLFAEPWSSFERRPHSARHR